MSVRFQKMQGLGNDFVIIDRRSQDFVPILNNVTALCDRHFGIGCDQLVVLDAPTIPAADVMVRFFNPDGSEAGACGNASRCVAALLGQAPVLQTSAGLLPTTIAANGWIGVDMGVPKTDWQDVPLASAVDTLELPFGARKATACSMGNPHATFFDGIDPAETEGPALEHDPVFPKRANIGFAAVRAPDDIRLRVWERGAGLTLACGSGACAAVVNGVRRGLLERQCRVEMDGGTLTVFWREDNHVIMTGPATHVFEGVWSGDVVSS